MKYTEDWLKRTALDYDMDIEEVRRIVNCCTDSCDCDDEDIYEEFENFIAERAYASENGLWGY